MNSKIFRSQRLISHSIAQRLFRQRIEENAIVEVNNLLASKDITTIRHEDLAAIDAHYGLRVKSDFSLNLEEFYAAYLNHCLKDGRLDHAEIKQLQHLKQLFCISDKVVSYLHEQIGGTAYRKTLETALADGKPDSAEAAFLKSLESALHLPKALAEKISLEVRSDLLREKLALASNDNRLSPEEEKELMIISKNIGLPISTDQGSRRKLQQMKLYWALENLPMPTVLADVPLQKGETCHYRSDAIQWKKISGKNWSVPNTGHLFDGKEIPVSTAYHGRPLEPVDKGTIYVTSKRVIFDGREKRTSLPLAKITRVKPYSDAIELVRETGKNPIFFCKEAAEPGIIIDRLMRKMV